MQTTNAKATRAKVGLVLALGLLVALLAVGSASAAPDEESPEAPESAGEGKDGGEHPTLRASAELRRSVKPAGILVHERHLQRIVATNPVTRCKTRASGTPGYAASADYVAAKLRRAGYVVSRQRFPFSFFDVEKQSFSQTAPQQRTIEPYCTNNGTGHYGVVRFSTSGEVTDAPVVPTKDIQIPPGPTENSSNSGCEPEDFVSASKTEEQVALIQRGTCPYGTKVQNAQNAGYDAAIIFNEGQQWRTDAILGTLDKPGVVEIPAIGISFELGRELYETQGARVSLDIRTVSAMRNTSNVIADTPGGRADRTVVVGAHLDSVAEGPGINDNGSGVATILEVALQMSKLGIKPTNRVRFAFWGAEEPGILGSEHYVESLSDRQLDRIALNLNFDMLGSPNYVRYVYDGDGSATPDDPDDAGPVGSANIERVFKRYFASQGLQTVPLALAGRSDYGPFIAADIPAGGLESGAEELKTQEQAAVYGGTAGKPLDSCYHQPCDDITNLSIKALDELSDGVAHATLTYAEAEQLFVGARSVGAARSAADTTYGEFEGPEEEARR